jgi:hypothetical protein
MSKGVVSFFIVLTVASIAALLAGGTLLEAALPGGLPLGNLVTACTLCAPAGAAVGLSPPKTLVRYFSLASLVAACAWLPISIALAGNLSLNFEGARGEMWFLFTFVAFVAVYCSLAWALVVRLLIRFRRGASSGHA